MSENNTDEIALSFVLFSVKLCKLKKDIRYLVKWQVRKHKRIRFINKCFE